MASGRPVIAYGAGGALETVIDGVTGVYFRHPTAESVIEAIQRLERMELDPAVLRAHAESFDVSQFKKGLKEIVDRSLVLHNIAYGRISPGHSENPSNHSFYNGNGNITAYNGITVPPAVDKDSAPFSPETES